MRWEDGPSSCIIAGIVANSIFHILSDFFARYGYWAVFFGVMLENIGVPVPGETVLLFAGFLAYQGKIQIIPAMLTAMAGATVGACLGFAAGRYAGAAMVGRFLGRFPRIAKRYDEAHQTFIKYGQWTVFAARFVTGLRVFAGLLAGALRMSFLDFLLFTFGGAACWAMVIGCVGYLFGSSWGRLVSIVGGLNRIALIALAGCVAVLLVVYLIQRWRKT